MVVPRHVFCRCCTCLRLAALCVLASTALAGTPVSARAAPGVLEGRPVPQRVLVMDLQATGVPEAVATTTTQLVAQHLGQRPELQVSTLADLKGALSLEQTKQLVGCRDGACLADLQRFTQADLVVAGSVGAIGKQVLLNLSLLDVKASRSLARASDTVDGTDAIAPALPGVLDRLFGWQGQAAGPRYALPQGTALSFAVMDLKATGLAEELAVNLTQVLGTEIKRVEGSKVISRDDIKAMLQLEQTKQLLACEDTSCMAELGGALGVDKLVVGHVGQLNQSYVISLRLIDPARASVDNRVTETYRGSADQLIGAVRHAGRQLLGVGEGATGTLAVGCSEEEAEVFVDGELAGVLPLPPLQSIAAGRHTVRLSRDGFFDDQSDIYVNPGEAAVVWAQLEERPTPWYQTWWFWTLTGGAVLAAGTAVGVVLALPGDIPDTASGTLTLRGAP